MLLAVLSWALQPDSEPPLPPDHAADLEALSGPDTMAIPEDPVREEGPALAALPADVAEADLVLGRRETFYDGVRRLGGGPAEIMSLVRHCKPYRDLGKVHGGEAFRIAVDGAGRVLRLSFELEDGESYLVFSRAEAGEYHVHELTYPVEQRVCAVSGVVDVSIFESLKACGAPTALAAKMNDILGWEVDFRRDVRSGDTFRILYEEVRREGRFLRTGDILAVEYVNQGEARRGFRYAGEDGRTRYFDETGRSLQKQLLRAPLQYSRISSSFSLRRLHPVHKRYMPHYGVDYAAPVGTPVWAAGDGKVVEAGYSKSNGRYVRIRHTNQSYETYYLHFKRIAKNIRRGVEVRQGEVIGYVGATGVATGPHLDFRVKRDGRWVNPRTLQLPASDPVPAGELPAFQALAALYGYGLVTLPPDGAPRVVTLDVPLAPAARTDALAPPRDESLLAVAVTAAP